MKKIFLFLILFISHQLLSQTYNYAVLSDLKIQNEKDTEKLSKIFEDIKSGQGIDFIVIIGNLTENGTDKEFDAAKHILNDLKLAYFIIPGELDAKGSDNSLFHFQELWKNENFFYKKNNDIHIGLNSISTGNSKGGHFSPNDLNWLNEVLKDSASSSTDTSNIILYLSNPLNLKIDNWFLASNILRNFNIKAAFSAGNETNKISSFNGIPGITVSSISDSKYPGYSLVHCSEDSVTITQIELGRKKTENILDPVLKNKHYSVPEIDSAQFIDYGNYVSWKKDLFTNSPASFEASSDKIFSASKDGRVFCFDLNGNKIWEYSTGETIISQPAIEKDILLVGTLEGDLFSFNVNNGNVIQVIGLGEPVTSRLIIVDAVNQDSKTKGVIAATANGNIFCYDIYTLENIWENNSAKGMIETRPLYTNNRIIYGSSDGFLYCIDARTGILNWKWKDKNSDYSFVRCEPVSDNKYVYISTLGKYTYAIDLLLGTTIWKMDHSSSESIGIGNNDKLFVKGSNKFYIISSETGKPIKEIKVDYDDDYSASRPLEWKNQIIFGSSNGNVYIIDQKYNLKKLFFAGTAKVNNIQNIKENIFAVSNIDGKVIRFKID